MILKNKFVQLLIALALGVGVMLLPRPEGDLFKVRGDGDKQLYESVKADFELVPGKVKVGKDYSLKVLHPDRIPLAGKYLSDKTAELGLKDVEVRYQNGLSPKAKRFLAVVAALIFLFVFEPIPLEITAIGIGVCLVATGVADVKDTWAAYMHPVVVFIMTCLILAIAMDKVGLTKRLGYFIVRIAGTNVVRFTFVLSIGLGIASAILHDAAATSIGIVTMLPLMRAAGIEPGSRTGKFMMLALPFACSAGGMGTLVGGGRCMVSAAFLKEFTGLELTFFDWFKYAMPGAILTVPAAVIMVYLIFRPDRTLRLPQFDEAIGPWSAAEKKALIITVLIFASWFTKGLHGIDYSVPGMIGVAAMVIFGILEWDDIHHNLEWGTALFIFGGGIALGLVMASSGAADYFASLFMPLVEGRGWLVLFAGIAVFGALITNAMANVAAAALILPIAIPMAQAEGVNPTILALCLGMATSFAMLLVIGCPPNAIAYSYRYFKSSDLTKAGIITMPVLIFILVVVAAIWWKILGLV